MYLGMSNPHGCLSLWENRRFLVQIIQNMIYMVYPAKGRHLICPVDGARQVGQLFGVSSFSALDSQTMCPIELSPSDLVACNRSCTPKHAFLFPWKDPLATFGTSPSPG